MLDKRPSFPLPFKKPKLKRAFSCPHFKEDVLLKDRLFCWQLSSGWNRFSGEQRDWVLKVLKVNLRRGSLKSNNLCLSGKSGCAFVWMSLFFVCIGSLWALCTHGVNTSLMTSVNMRNDYRKQNLVETGSDPVRQQLNVSVSPRVEGRWIEGSGN